ncbi:MAG: ESX secretion-associated protein EspG [Rhodococcus sp. (in: high G+C Gram-positive bacteria)]
MNGRSWTLGGLEFRMLMEHAGRDRLPFPIQFQPTADSAADYHRQRHEAAESVARMMDDDLRLAIHTLVTPNVRVEVVGHRSSSPISTEKIRGHAARGHEIAVVATQQPADTDRSGGAVTLSLLEPFRAVAAVLKVLPPADGGTAPRMDVAYADASVETQSPLVRRAGRRTDEDRYEALFSRAPTCAGEILVCTGSAADNRLEESTTGVNWVDFADDGRYLIRHGAKLCVLPASTPQLVTEIAGLVGEALAAV